MGIKESKAKGSKAKGSKNSIERAQLAEALLERLAPIDGVSSKKMFGGHGFFQEGKMFAMLTSEGEFHLKAGDANRERFLEAGEPQFHRMPYFRVPDSVLAEDESLLEWARASVAVAHS